MTVRVVAAGLALVLGTAGCGGDGGTAPTSTSTAPVPTTSTSTVPEPPPSTTTTMFDPATVEGQVEAAYLKSWDVYAHAVYHLELDEQAFADVYAGSTLETRIDELRERIAAERAAFVFVEHDYEIQIISEDLASVIDEFTNHQVLIDPETRQPIEPDPGEVLLVNHQLKRIGGEWRITFIQKLS